MREATGLLQLVVANTDMTRRIATDLDLLSLKQETGPENAAVGIIFDCRTGNRPAFIAAAAVRRI